MKPIQDKPASTPLNPLAFPSDTNAWYGLLVLAIGINAFGISYTVISSWAYIDEIEDFSQFLIGCLLYTSDAADE